MGRRESPVTAVVGDLSTRQLVILWGVLAGALILRTVSLDWGLPPTDPITSSSGIRSSYAFDEAPALHALAQTNPAAGDIDPRRYVWGTFHLQVVLATLEIAESIGVFREPWRQSFLEMTPGEFERVYVVSRLPSAGIDVLTVFLVYLLGRRLAGIAAGLWAGAIYAVAPGAIVHATQLRVDVSATMLVALTCLFALNRERLISLGVVAGLAISAKYSVAPMALAIVAWRLWHGSSRQDMAAVGLGAATGFLIGEPVILTNGAEVLRQLLGQLSSNVETPEALRISAGLKLLEVLHGLARFSLTLPAAVFAALGLYGLGRRRGFEGWLIPIAVAVGWLSILPLTWPLMRYHLPLVPLCALAAGLAIANLRRSEAFGTLALVFALAGSIAQIRYMLAPHTANLAISMLHKVARPGGEVARIMPEMPPLPVDLYPMGPNPLLDDLRPARPEWVILADLPVVNYPQPNLDYLAEHYQRIAVFRSRRLFWWATLGEKYSPHDWKYSHPELTLFRRGDGPATE